MAETPGGPQRDGAARSPRWVYAVGVVLILLALAYLLLGEHMGHVIGGGVPHH